MVMYYFIGQFINEGIEVDTQRKMLIFSDGRLPLPVTNDSSMSDDHNRQCWKVANHGNQGEGLIHGTIFDYIVPHLLGNKRK